MQSLLLTFSHSLFVGISATTQLVLMMLSAPPCTTVSLGLFLHGPAFNLHLQQAVQWHPSFLHRHRVPSGTLIYTCIFLMRRIMQVRCIYNNKIAWSSLLRSGNIAGIIPENPSSQSILMPFTILKRVKWYNTVSYDDDHKKNYINKMLISNKQLSSVPLSFNTGKAYCKACTEVWGFRWQKLYVTNKTLKYHPYLLILTYCGYVLLSSGEVVV